VNKNKVLLLILILILSCTSCAQEDRPVVSKQLSQEEEIRAEHQYPVRWTGDVTSKVLKGIDEMLDNPVDMLQSGGELKLTNDEGKEVKVATCREYWNYKNQGFAPYTTYDRAMESWFINACNPLKFLMNIKPSKVSYLTDFDLTENPLQILPCTLDLNLSDDEVKKAKEFIAKGLTWKDFAPNKKIEVINKNEIKLEDDSSITWIVLSAFADFNNDGIEDILLDVSHQVKGGSNAGCGHSILTRLEKNGVLRVLEDEP